MARWDGRRSFSHGHGLSATERRQVEQIVGDLNKALAEPVTEPTVRRSAKMLVASMKQSGETFSAADLVASLVIALNGRREAALAEAVRQILAFEADGFSKKYMPATPEIADLTRRIEQRWALQRESLAAMLKMDEQHAPVKERQPTPEEMADWRARAARLGRSAAVASQKALQGSAAGRVAADLERRRAATTG